MPATVTLSTTTLLVAVGPSDKVVKVGSVSGLTPGTRLYLDGELMQVVSLGIETYANVNRGVDGTQALPHDSGATVYVGRGDQFYSQDPTGSPPEAIPVSPYINARNGTFWFAQGGTAPDGKAFRWWQKQTIVYGTTSFGVRTTTLDPTAST